MRTALLFVLVAMAFAKYEHTGNFKVVASDCDPTDKDKVSDFNKDDTIRFTSVTDVKLWPWTLDGVHNPTYEDSSEAKISAFERVYVLTQNKPSADFETGPRYVRLYYTFSDCESLEVASCTVDECLVVTKQEQKKDEDGKLVFTTDPDSGDEIPVMVDVSKCEQFACEKITEKDKCPTRCDWAEPDKCSTKTAVVETCDKSDGKKEECEGKSGCYYDADKCKTRYTECKSYEDPFSCWINFGCDEYTCDQKDYKLCKWTTKCEADKSRRQSRRSTRDVNMDDAFECEWDTYPTDEPNKDGKYLTCERITAQNTKNYCTFTMEYTGSAQTVFASIALAFVAMLFVLF